MRRKSSRKTKLTLSMLAVCVSQTGMAALTMPVLATGSQDAQAEGKEAVSQITMEPKTSAVSIYDGSERSADFNAAWNFRLGEASGAEQPAFDDSGWQSVNLPHDYSISQDYNAEGEAESAYLLGGVGWYRKSFSLDESVKGKRVRIDFDGVYMNSTVYINGHELGFHPYGYSPFSYDLSDYINYEGENVISVKVDHQLPSSRWYSGSGIYRDVHLTITDAVHVDRYGTYVQSPNLEAEKDGAVATAIETTLQNDADAAAAVTVRQSIARRGSTERLASVEEEASLAAGETKVLQQTLMVNKPDLWSTDTPNLYTITTEILKDGAVIDSYETLYGYRYFNFDANTGFSLNGKSMKLNGVCMHHDNGALGAVADRRATERQIEILQEMGVNAIRTSHNPGSEVFLQLCAEKGILVMEEFLDGWSNPKNGNTEDFSKAFNQIIGKDNEVLHKKDNETWAQYVVQEVIRRSRSNPALLIWDIGNEVEHGNVSSFPQIADNLIAWIKEMDERPFILGDNKTLNNDTSNSRIVRQKIADAGGLIGSNYGLANNLQRLYRNDHPDWKFLGTENVSSVNSRGVYNRIASQQDLGGDQQLTSYDYSCVDWGHAASQAMLGFVENDWYAGEFVWTGFDYLGEPTPWWSQSPGVVGTWPSPKNSYFGIVDTAGLPKDTYYFYRSIWRQDDTTLHMLPAWKDGVVYKNAKGEVPVVVYTNAHSVKLEFTDTEGNTREISTKTFNEKTTANGYKYRLYEGSDKESQNHRNLYLTWYVPYEDGTLHVTAYDEQGNEISKTTGRNTVSTYGAPAKLKAEADRQTLKADGKDLVYVTVDVTDAEGLEAADAANLITFDVEGEGELVGVDNGSSPDHQSYQDSSRKAFSGKVVAIVRTTNKAGDITVTAAADGLESASVTVHAEGGSETTALEGIRYARSCYVKAGMKPELPQSVELLYSDGSKKEAKAEWQAYDSALLEENGTFAISGSAEGQPLNFYVNVIEKAGAVQNYSTAIKPGQIPELPSERPVLLPDGTRLAASFPVDWEDLSQKDFSKEGMVTVSGSASVLGETFPVTASIRVAEEALVYTENVIPGLAFEISQDIPESKQSDNIQAIKDGQTALGKGTSAGNTTCWSNYAWSQDGNTTSELTIKLDTGQTAGKLVIYFGADHYAMSYPKAGETTFEYTPNGVDWYDLEVQEEIGAEANNTRPYTYTFDPTNIRNLKIHIKNTDDASDAVETPCTGITEVELYPVISGFALGSSTGVESITLNGKEEILPDPQAKTYASTAWLARNPQAAGKDNASVTILKQEDESLLLYVESEDHSASRLMEITLKKPVGLPADDASGDYPVSMLTAAADSIYPGSGSEGPVSHVLDGNAQTWWHTDWSSSEAEDLAMRHVDLIFEEPQLVGALRYLPRNSGTSGGRNGQVVTYKVQVQSEAGSEWKDVAEGEWEYSTGWKIAEFTPQMAKAVRLVGVETVTNGVTSSTDMSVAELRLARGLVRKNLKDLENLSLIWPQQPSVKPGAIDLSDEILIKEGESELCYGSDYILEYEIADASHITITITGIGEYTGSLSKTIAADIEAFDDSLARLSASALASLVEEITAHPDQYNADLPALQEVLDQAQAVLAAPKSQDELNTAARNLNQALLAIRFKADPAKLETLSK